MRARAVLAAALAAALLAGCSGDDGTAATDPPPTTAADGAITQIVADLNAYWSEADTEIAPSYDYTPVPEARVSVGGDGTRCDGQEISEAEVRGNAFVADCREGLIVAFDPDYLARSQARAEATLAHEWGHVLQLQAGPAVDLSTDPGGLPIDAELQADCFAGAWSAENGEADFDALLADVEDSGDPPGVAVHDPEAHGTAEERRTAYEIGLDHGPEACVTDLVDVLPG